MRVLLVNKFYYPRGGDCIYTLNLETLLTEKGHDVGVFAMQHPHNNETPFRRYFPSEVTYSSVSGESNRWKALTRPLGAREVKRKFTDLLNDFRPEVVHLNNIHTHLSPVLAEMAHRKGIRVVWTLHDYKLLCHRSDCLRNDQPCELCYRNKSAVLKHNCVKNSKAASLLAYFESLQWNRRKLERYTDVFICPSRFMKEKMLAGGFRGEKLQVVHNFTTLQNHLADHSIKEDYFCYIGRISIEKGIETLVTAAQQTPYSLKIAGKGPLFDDLKNRYESDKIVFPGYLNQDEIRELIEKARFVVLPSEWYENNPLSVLEALCLGTPVLGSDMGGIPELITAGKNGMIFKSKNKNDLSDKIRTMFALKESFNSLEIKENALSKFSAERYYAQLSQIYNGRNSSCE